MKCILHIGMAKAGSTSLQAWLDRNRNALINHGVYIPKSFGGKNNRSFSGYFQSSTSDNWSKQNGYLNIDSRKKLLKPSLQRFREEVSNLEDNVKVVIVSAEHLSSRLSTKSEIKDLKNYLDRIFSCTEIVCYVREQYDALISQYSTAVRGSENKSITEFVKYAMHKNEVRYRYAEFADLWSDVFGEENCDFRVYKSGGIEKENIVIDFMGRIHVDARSDEFDTHLDRKNQSLTAVKAILYAFANRLYPRWIGENNIQINEHNSAMKNKIDQHDWGMLADIKIQTELESVVSDFYRDQNERFFRLYVKGDQVSFECKDLPEERVNINSSDIEKLLQFVETEITRSTSEDLPSDDALPLDENATSVKSILTKLSLIIRAIFG